MKKQIRKYIASLMLLSTALLIAQEENTLQGVVSNGWNHKSVSFANVLIENQETQDYIAGAVTTVEGRYEFIGLHAGTYRICVSFLGFESDTLFDVVYDGKPSVMLDTIFIKRQKTQLEELNIVAERPMIIQSAGKTTLNVNEAMSGSGESAIELLKYLPSTSTDEEDNILLRGAPATIMIDGVETDLANALDALPMGMIDKVEIITNPSAKYSSQNGSGIINIILKTDKKKGANGRVNVAIGIPQRSQMGGNIMLSHKKWTSYSNVNYNRYTDTQDVYSERNTINTSTPSTLYSESTTDKEYNKLNFRQGVKYQIDGSSSVRADATFRYDKYDGEATGGVRKIANDTILKSENKNYSSTGSEKKYWNISLDYRKEFKDRSKLSMIMKHENQNEVSPYHKRIEYYNVITNEPKDNYLIQTRTNPEQIKSWRLQTDYERDLNKRMKLETGMLLLQRNSEAESNFIKTKYTQTYSNTIATPDSSQMYDYNVNELSSSAYIMYIFENDDWSLSGGLRYEYVHYNANAEDSSSTSQHHNLLPSLQVTRKLNDKFTIGIASAMRTKMPKYQQLNPIEVYNGLYSKSLGNPELLPERITNLEFNVRHQFEKHNVTSALFYKRFENMIGRQQYYITEEDREVLVKQFDNIGQVDQYGLDFNMNSRLAHDIKLKTNLLLFGQNINSEFQGETQEVTDFTWSAKVIMDQVLWKDLRWQLTTGYTAPIKNINGEKYDIFYTNIGVSKKLFGGKATVGAQLSDIFDTIDREYINNSSPKYEQYGYSKNVTQKLLFSFTYRFNTMGDKSK